MRALQSLLYLVCGLLAAPAGATGLPEVVPITQDSASELGFSIIPTVENGSIVSVEVTGPAVDSQGCRAARSGTALIHGEHEFVTITELPDEAGRPRHSATTGYVGALHIFVDYLYCPEGVRPRRYDFVPQPK